MVNVTRGGLKPASIDCEELGTTVPCMFNPYEYTLTKTNNWTPAQADSGRNTPRSNFSRGGQQTLKLTLHFDTLESGKDVRDLTDPLWKMMMINEDKVEPESNKGKPPEVAFAWGRLYFKAVISNLSQKFTLFKDDGTPLRCQVDITLVQHEDIDDYREQIPSTLAQLAPKAIQAVEGDRIDNIAAQVAEEGLDIVRELLEKNNIDNPLNIAPGRLLRF